MDKISKLLDIQYSNSLSLMTESEFQEVSVVSKCQLGLSCLLILIGLLQKGNPVFAQVTADPSLGTKVTPNGNTQEITGGTTVGDKNLFHSFSNFSVKSDEIVDFQNASTINNILVRVTGRNFSDIQGILKAHGNANLFLINPKGIVFGENAELDIGGSFIGTTANGIQFPGGGEFSMTSPVNPQNPLLTVNPSALLFNQISSGSIGSIQVNGVLLSVPDAQSILLVGGDINLLEGAQLVATSGRVELGGLNAEGTVKLNMDSNNFRLSFPQGVQRADVSLTNATVTTPDSEVGIQVQGRRVKLAEGSEIRAINTFGTDSGGTLAVTASESVELLGGSRLLTTTESTGDAGNIKIETGRLIVQEGAQVSASTNSNGRGGTLSVNAKDSIQLIGTSPAGNSGLFVRTTGTGDAGNLEIETGRLIIQDKAGISASASRTSTGKGGSITIKTGTLDVLKGGQVNVSSAGSGDAGELTVKADSIFLDSEGKLAGTTTSGSGGNITLEVRDLIRMRNRSGITTTARNNGDGGNITINAPNGFIVADRGENSDITANAFEGQGGKIKINAAGIFGIAPLSREDLQRLYDDDSDGSQLPTNDITAISQTNPSLSGTVTLNTPDVDPSRGLVEQNTNLVDVSGQIDAGCTPGSKQTASSFVVTGRGGIPPSPFDMLTSDAVQVDMVTLPSTEAQHQSRGAIEKQRTIREYTHNSNYVNPPTQIVEAQGWVVDANGDTFLVASSPTVTPHSSLFNPASCQSR